MYRLIMLALSPEITEAGEEIECVVEAIGTKCPAHVVNIKPEVIVAEFAGIGYTGRRQVNTSHVITQGCQDSGMPASAACDIQHPGTGRRGKQCQQPLNKASRFGLISFKIQFVVI